jgi:hypothetical protein
MPMFQTALIACFGPSPGLGEQPGPFYALTVKPLATRHFGVYPQATVDFHPVPVVQPVPHTGFPAPDANGRAVRLQLRKLFENTACRKCLRYGGAFGKLKCPFTNLPGFR